MELTPALVEIVVADMAAALAFYRRLGLAIPDGSDAEPHVDVEFGSLRLAFDTEDTVRSFEPDWRPSSGGHPFALAFRAPSPAAVDEAFAELVAAGAPAKHEPWDAFWGMRYAVVLDPDGNPVDLFADL